MRRLYIAALLMLSLVAINLAQTHTGGGGTSGGGTPGGAVNSVQYNNGGAFGGFGTWNGSTFAIPNAASNGILFSNANGRVTGSGGGYLNFDGNGSPSLTASGTNQNITLTPSGTGGISYVSQGYTSTLTFNSTGDVTLTGGRYATLHSSGNVYLQSQSGQNLSLGPVTVITTGTSYGIVTAVGIIHKENPVSCTSNCTADLHLGDIVEFTLSQAVTSVALNNPNAGDKVTIIWIQDATGETFSGSWQPSGWHGISAPGSTASTYSVQTCTYITGSKAICEPANTNIP